MSRFFKFTEKSRFKDLTLVRDAVRVSLAVLVGGGIDVAVKTISRR